MENRGIAAFLILPVLISAIIIVSSGVQAASGAFHIALTGSASAEPGETMTIGLSVDDISDSAGIVAVTVKSLTYDPEKVEYISGSEDFSSVPSDNWDISANNNANGSIRLMFNERDGENGVKADGSLSVTLKFKVKASVTSGNMIRFTASGVSGTDSDTDSVIGTGSSIVIAADPETAVPSVTTGLATSSENEISSETRLQVTTTKEASSGSFDVYPASSEKSSTTREYTTEGTTEAADKYTLTNRIPTAASTTHRAAGTTAEASQTVRQTINSAVTSTSAGTTVVAAKTTALLPQMPEMISGDVDGSGQVTAADARMALRAAIGLGELSNASFKAADVDLDNKVTAADSRIILRAAVGLDELSRVVFQLRNS